MKHEQALLSFLKAYKGKRLAVDDLIQQTKSESYTEAANTIQTIEKKGHIARIEGSGTNGRVPKLYNRYQLLIQTTKDDYSKEEIDKELLMLHPKIKTHHYSKYRKTYLKHREAILKISSFLKRCDKEDIPYVATNERSFEWFKDEKYLHSLIHSGETNLLEPQKKSTFLNNLGLTLDDLKVYESNESFFYYVKPTNHPQHHILIVENKDTYVSLQKLLIENEEVKFEGINEPITGVIYGEGFKIIDSLRTAFTHPDSIFSSPTTHYWYLGDLDYAGLNIYLILYENYKTLLNLNYFPNYFSYLIQVFEKKFPSEKWPTVSDKGKKHQPLNPDVYRSLLPQSVTEEIIQQLEQDGYLPQETMSQSDWRTFIKK